MSRRVFFQAPPRSGRLRMLLLLPLAVPALLAAAAGDAKAPEKPPTPDKACLECHSDTELTMQRGTKGVSLFVDPAVLGKSAHEALKCVDCHEDFDATNIPHKKPMTAVDCAGCHEGAGASHVFHRRLAQSPVPAGDDTSCTSCHGSHAVARVAAPAFPFSRARQAEACGRCHGAARDQYLASAHGRTASANPDVPGCVACHSKPVVNPSPKSTVALKLAQAALCESCHVSKASVAGQALRGSHFVSSFDQSVHGAALHRGNASSANCVDCHGAHEMNLELAASARTGKVHVAATCAKCHAAVAGQFASSVHAVALGKGSADAPTCTDCHGEHDIRAHTDPTSPVFAGNIAQQVCARCHASLRLTREYGLTTNQFQTFSDSYHGLAQRGGSVEVANCASCHSAHAIKSELDPTSSIYKGNLVKTCGQCHPGANARFTVGLVHVSPKAADGKAGSSPILHLIATLYVILIVVVIGGMTFHNAIDLLKKIRRKLAIQKGVAFEEPVAHRLYLRMTAQERLQHAALMVSFTALVVTGFMLSYPEAWWVVAIRHLSPRAFELRGLIHRVAGVAMLGVGAWHVAYLALTPEGRGLFRDLLPRKRDLTDPWKVLKYNLGLAKEKPAFERFCYIEKAEYWAMIWGTLLMGATGAVLWFDNKSMGLLTKLGFDISRTIHYYEAVLATLAIIVWHFYFVIFNPDVYPMSLAWLTGRVSEREMLEEHALELERLKKSGPPEPPPGDESVP